MKKHLILTAILLFCLCSCGTQTETNLQETTTLTQITAIETTTETTTHADTQDSTQTDTEESSEDESEVSTYPTEFEYTNKDNYESPLLLCDNDFMKVEMIGWVIADDNFSGKIEIENKSDQNIRLTIDNSSVNDYETTMHLYADVTAGKKAVNYIVITESDISKYDFHGKDFEKLEFIFKAIDQDSWDSLFESEIITIPIEQN